MAPKRPNLAALQALFIDPAGAIAEARRAVDTTRVAADRAHDQLLSVARQAEAELAVAVRTLWSTHAVGTGYPYVTVAAADPITVTVDTISPLGSIKVSWRYTPDGEPLEAWVARVSTAWSLMSASVRVSRTSEFRRFRVLLDDPSEVAAVQAAVDALEADVCWVDEDAVEVRPLVQVRAAYGDQAAGTYAVMDNGDLQILGFNLPVPPELHALVNRAYEVAHRTDAQDTAT